MLGLTKLRHFGVGFLIVGLLLAFFNIPVSIAAYSNVSDTISDSRVSISASHVITFTTASDIGVNGYYEITLADEYGDIKYASCSGPNATVSTTTETVRCTYSVSPGAATTTTIYVDNVTNPSVSGRYNVLIGSYNSGDTDLEHGDAAVYITNALTASAWIGSILNFEMTNEDVSEVNGVTITGSSTVDTLPFGELNTNASTTLAQTLTIQTNAKDGFSCTVQQDQELTNQSNHTINSFDNSPDGTGSSTSPHTWNAPTGELNAYHTYGHLGLTTDDDSLSSLDFSGSKYAGLNNSDPLEVFYHNGPVIQPTLGMGKAHIAYTIEISALQEEGNYNSNLTYVCTGNY